MHYKFTWTPLTSSGHHAGVDWVQENVLGQGQQSNESAVEQAKDEQISGRLKSTDMGRTVGVAVLTNQPV